MIKNLNEDLSPAIHGAAHILRTARSKLNNIHLDKNNISKKLRNISNNAMDIHSKLATPNNNIHKAKSIVSGIDKVIDYAAALHGDYSGMVHGEDHIRHKAITAAPYFLSRAASLLADRIR